MEMVICGCVFLDRNALRSPLSPACSSSTADAQCRQNPSNKRTSSSSPSNGHELVSLERHNTQIITILIQNIHTLYNDRRHTTRRNTQADKGHKGTQRSHND